ncbi:UNVERIFIED_CONTAM: Type 2 DNA topoisomerase 6 subunit B-like [Sesamum radiatum]|uniref:Type 2 DNA topoisomerase 6 subunit B-like n=1 Tax=Sesamum radiatum TaxID=300843 RepID=A0AAW2RE98_SESRA
MILIEGISDKEIHHLKIDLKEVVSSRRLVRLASATKNGAKFSGTEVSMSMYEEIDGLLTMISVFVRKMLLLRAPKIAVELSVESAHCVESQSQSIVLQNSCRALPMHAENIDHLKLGFQEYVSKHGNRVVEACPSCFSTGCFNYAPASD